MSVERLTADLAIISQLGDYPGIQDGLSTAEFKAKFDEAGLTIQSYINDVLVPGINSLDPNGGESVSYLPVSGGKMLGQINMNSKRITNLPTPSADRDAVPRSYVLPKSGGTMTGPIYMDNNRISDIGSPISPGDAAPKSYVDEKSLLKSGGTVDGNLSIGRTDDTTQRNLYVRRSINGSTRSLRVYWTDDDSLRAAAAYGGSVDNYMELQADKTVFKKPVAIESGGTDATNATDALNNLGGLSKAGGTMAGPIDMDGKKITGLADPSSNRDAAHKSYVDSAVEGAKSYADSKRIDGTCTLTAAKWQSDGTQTVNSSRVYADDMPHWCVVYSSDASTREAEKEAFALVDELETEDGAFVFRCFGDVPTVDLNIQWEVNR